LVCTELWWPEINIHLPFCGFVLSNVANNINVAEFKVFKARAKRSFSSGREYIVDRCMSTDVSEEQELCLIHT
jgi:hypothetical protein